MRIIIMLATILIIPTHIIAKEYLAYQYQLIEKTTMLELVEILSDKNMNNSAKAYMYDSILSLNDFDELDELKSRISIEILPVDVKALIYNNMSFKLGFYAEVPSVYNTKFALLPELSISYDSTHISSKLLLFEKINHNVMNSSMSNFVFGREPSDSLNYSIVDGKLLIETAPDINEEVFNIACPQYNVVVSSLGTVVFVQYYDSITFFNKTFHNIYEFLFMTNYNGDDYEILIWFNNEYDLLRLETSGHGYLSMKKKIQTQ